MMILRTIVLVLVLVASLLAGQAVARADAPPAPTAAETAEAKKFFEAGMSFFKERRFEEALAAFTEANRRVPRPSTERNIAQCHRELNDLAAAYVAYETLLARHGDALKPADRAEVDRALGELAVVTGVVSVTVPEANAIVSVDGKELGPSPRVVRLNVGAHTVAVSKPDFERLEQKVTIAGRDVVAIAGPLVPLLRMGQLSVVVEPEGKVPIFVDDREVGIAPWEGAVSIGPHRVFARDTELESAPMEVVIGKEPALLRLPLRRQPGTMPQLAALHVRVDVLDAEISLDGVTVGRTTHDGRLARGIHRLRVSKAGYSSYQRTIDVQGAELITENVSLQRDEASAPADTAAGEIVDVGWNGLYGRFDFLGLFPTAQANNVHEGTVYGPSSSGAIGLLLGGGLGLRIGYSFGLLGVEGIANATYDHASITVIDPTLVGAAEYSGAKTRGRTDDWFFHRVGGTFAAGGRVMGKTILRPTAGAALGVSIKSVLFRREVRDLSTSNDSESKVYATPTLLFDAGIELGSRSGTRFFLGMIMHLDLPGPQALDSSSVTIGKNALPSGTIVRAATSAELFIGPILGFRFGH